MDSIRRVYRKLAPTKLRRFIHARLKHQPQTFEKAKALYASCEWKKALACVDSALKRNGTDQNLLGLRGRILLAMGRLEEARSCASALLALYPLDKHGRQQLAALGVSLPPARVSAALEHIKEQTPGSYVQAAEYLYDGELFEAAIDVCDQGIEAGKETATLLRLKANSLYELNRYEEAAQVYQHLSETYPRSQGAIGLARSLLEMGKPAQAEAAYTATDGEPPLPWSPALLDALQAQGKIRESYLYYRERPLSVDVAEYFGMEAPRSIDLNTGRLKNKSTFLLSEGGPGDEARISSIYLDLIPHFKDLCISSDPRLIAIMRRTFPEIKFLPVSRYRANVARDMNDRQKVKDQRVFHCVSDDAAEFGRTVDFVAALFDTLADVRHTRESFTDSQRRYLLPDPDLKSTWRSKVRHSSRAQIGIAWRSMLETATRSRHYFSVEDLRPLLSMDADFWVLQPRVRDDELTKLRSMGSIRVPNGLDLVDDIEGQLALMSCLDCVVSPFATTGELASAAGVPTILVSGSRNTLWRRNDDGTDIFSPSTRIVSGNPLHDKLSAVEAAALDVRKVIERTQSQTLTS